jgi:serpin B
LATAHEEFAEVMHLEEPGVSLKCLKALNEDVNCSLVDHGGKLDLSNTVNPTPDGIELKSLLFFKDKWFQKFDKPETRDDFFYKPDQSKIIVPMMSAKFGGVPGEMLEELYFDKCVLYSEGPGFQLVALPYVGKKIAMFIFLPTEIDGIFEFDKNLTIQMLEEAFSHMKLWKWGVQVYLPRFEINMDLNLNSCLQSLGLKTAYISDLKNEKFRGLGLGSHVKDATQSVDVKVYEEGTTLLAVSCMTLTGSDGEPYKPKEEPKIVRADHPFFFIIKHLPSNSKMLLGRVMDPETH